MEKRHAPVIMDSSSYFHGHHVESRGCKSTNTSRRENKVKHNIIEPAMPIIIWRRQQIKVSAWNL